MHIFENASQKMTYAAFGSGDTAFVWAHGWGQNHNSMEGLAHSLSFMGKHYLLDLPGFGGSTVPDNWFMDDYKKFIGAFIDSLPEQKVVFVGHSFGCRIGVKLAADAHSKITHYILIGAHGLPRQRSITEKISFYSRVYSYKFFKFFMRHPKLLNRLRKYFGSPDYRSAGAIRQTFLNIINENLQDTAALVDKPVLLIYGEKDDETPPNMGQRYAKLMRNARFSQIADFDHYTILTSGKHQVTQLIKNFIQG